MSKPIKSPKKTKRNKWIAERVLVRSDALGGRVIVRIGTPEIDHPYTNWRCPFVIEGLGDESIHFGKSDNSMAALQNALIGIRNVLEQTGIPLRWEGFDEDLTGFSRDVPWEYGLAFYQRINRMIDAEIEEHTRAIREQRERREASRKSRKKPQSK